MKKTTNFVGVDLDWVNPRTLLTRYIVARYYFKDKGDIRVYISSSKSGYHMRIKTDYDMSILENLYWRALLGDDPSRINFSIKRIITDPNGTDVLFDQKGNGEDIDITSTMEKFVDPYINEAFELIHGNEDFDDVIVVTDKIVSDMTKEGVIKTNKVNVLVVDIPERLITEFSDLGRRISSKYGLKFRIIKSLEKDRDFYFTLSGDKDDSLMRWGKWINSKFGTHYWLKQIKHDIIYEGE